MLLTIEKENELIIKNDNNKISFKCLDENTFKAIKGYLYKVNKKELEFFIKIISFDKTLLIFSTGYKLLIPKIMGLEIINRINCPRRAI